MGAKEPTEPKGTPAATPPPPTSKNEFLAELKEKYDKDIAWKEALDNKADKMITMSSAIATLLVGIGTFLVSKIEPASWLYYMDVFILMIGIILAGIAIAFFIFSFRVRDFHFPFGPADIYFPDVIKCGWRHIFCKRFVEGKGKICIENLTAENIGKYLAKDKIELGWKLTNSEFAEHAINQYIKMMKLNSEVLLIKANYLSYGQWLFLASILSVSLVLVATLIGIGTGIAFIERVQSVANEFPISNAGSDQETVENKTVILDGSDSRDRDGSITSYFWNQTSGYKVDILNSNDISAAFTAPDVANATQLEFKLRVTDNKNGTSDDTVKVIVKNDTFQDSSNPIICNGVVPYGVSYQENKEYFHTVVTNNSENPFGNGCILRGDFEEASNPFPFVHATSK